MVIEREDRFARFMWFLILLVTYLTSNFNLKFGNIDLAKMLLTTRAICTFVKIELI